MGSFTGKSLDKDTDKPILDNSTPCSSHVSHLAFFFFSTSDGDFFYYYLLHYLVLLMGDEGKDDSSDGSLKIPTPVPENPGKLEPLCFYHRYPLSR